MGGAQLLEVLLAAAGLIRVDFAGNSSVGASHVSWRRLPSDCHIDAEGAALCFEDLHQGALGHILRGRHAEIRSYRFRTELEPKTATPRVH